MKRGVCVIGAGGHAKVVIAVLEAVGYGIACVLDDDSSKWGSSILGHRISGPTSILRKKKCPAVLAVGSNKMRKALDVSLRGVRWLTIVHPSSWVHGSVSLGPGTVVMAGAVIQPDTVIGRHGIINTAASVDHDCRIGDFCHVAPGARLGGGVILCDCVLMGIGAVAKHGTSVGAGTVIGAGAAVVSDIPALSVAVGVPARPRKCKV